MQSRGFTYHHDALEVNRLETEHGLRKCGYQQPLCRPRDDRHGARCARGLSYFVDVVSVTVLLFLGDFPLVCLFSSVNARDTRVVTYASSIDILEEGVVIWADRLTRRAQLGKDTTLNEGNLQ